MSWEKRGKRRYYYRVRRENGRFVKEYVGCGPQAEEIARRDAADRAKRQKRDALEAAIVELEERTKLYIEATMYAAGYHKPKRGPWRKRRVRRDDSAAESKPLP